MAIINRLSKKLSGRVERNAKCGCGSGLKTKHCHGDKENAKVVNIVANLAMNVLIHHRRNRAGLSTDEQCDEVVGKLQSMIFDVLDPSYTPKAQEQKGTSETVKLEDKRCNDQEEVTPEPVKGQEKINSIRGSAGVGQCPKCLGIMLAREKMCFKCKKGQANGTTITV